MFTEEDWAIEEEEFFNSLQEIEEWGFDDEEEYDEDGLYNYLEDLNEEELNFEKG